MLERLIAEVAGILGQGLARYYAAGKILMEIQGYLRHGGVGKTWDDVAAALPVGRRQIFNILRVCRHRKDLEAAGIRRFSEAVTYLARRKGGSGR